MACNCIEYECIDIDYDPCSSGVLTPLIADKTGVWVQLLEFNGTWVRLIIEVTDGEPIVLANILNEHYRHTLRLLREDKSVFGDKCYILTTQVVDGSGIPLPTPQPSGGVQDPIYFDILTGQSDYQFNELIGAEILLFQIESVTIPPDGYTFDPLTGTITIDQPFTDQQGYILYKK